MGDVVPFTPPEKKLDELVAEYASGIADEWQGVKISGKVKQDIGSVRFKLAKRYQTINDLYEDHANKTNENDYSSTLEGLVEFARSLGDKVENPELQKLEANDFGYGKIKDYITSALIQTREEFQKNPEAAREETRRLLREFFNPKDGRPRSKEVFGLLRMGAQFSHQEYIANGIEGMHFGEYTDDQRKELAAAHNHLIYTRSGHVHHIPLEETYRQPEKSIMGHLSGEAQRYLKLPDDRRVKFEVDKKEYAMPHRKAA